MWKCLWEQPSEKGAWWFIYLLEGCVQVGFIQAQDNLFLSAEPLSAEVWWVISIVLPAHAPWALLVLHSGSVCSMPDCAPQPVPAVLLCPLRAPVSQFTCLFLLLLLGISTRGWFLPEALVTLSSRISQTPLQQSLLLMNSSLHANEVGAERHSHCNCSGSLV